jgi:hypothetical protein
LRIEVSGRRFSKSSLLAFFQRNISVHVFLCELILGYLRVSLCGRQPDCSSHSSRVVFSSKHI